MKLLQTLIVALMAVVIIGLLTERACNKPIKTSSTPVEARTAEIRILSPRELQTFLKGKNIDRYDPGKVDGRIGTNTISAWENYCCDQYAVKEFKRYE